MKNRRALGLLVLAVAFGITAAILVQKSLEQESTITVAKVETTKVVVAGADLAVSTGLAMLQLETVDWPSEFLPKGSFHDPSALEGRVLRHALAAGEVIQEASLLPLGSVGGLEAVIGENLRAVSVKVDPIVGVAGFVRPGARVDVLATIERTDWRNKQAYAKSVLQNVKVLAIDQKLEEVGKGEPELVSVVTLEVNPKQAEQLTFMSHEGKLQLALRSPGDQEIVKTTGTTVSRLFDGAKPKAARRNSVQVLKGTKVSSKLF